MIVVSGATGRVGRLVSEEVAARGEATRLLAREPAAAPALRGSEVVRADYGDDGSLGEALRAGDRVFMVSLHRAPEERIRLHRAFVDAAARARVARLVYLSFVNAGPDALFSHARSHGATEQALRDSGIPWTIIRNGMYADDVLDWFDDDGVAREAGGTGRMSFSYRPELARAIAVALTGSGHDGMTYDVTTADSQSLAELARTVSQVTGVERRYEPAGEDAWRVRWRALGRPDWELEAGLSSYAALRAGELDVVSDDYRALTGVAPRSIRDVVECSM